jgi:hypothetical protein
MSHELDELILKNLSDLDGASVRLNKLDERMSEEICKVVAHWCGEQDWVGKFEDGDSLWLAPQIWAIPNEKGFDADVWFQWADGAGDHADYDAGDDYWNLTRLTRAGRGKSGFRLTQTRVGKKLFSPLLVSHARDGAYKAFELDDVPSLFRAFSIDPSLIPDAMQDGDFAEALHPVIAALSDIKDIVPSIEAWLPARK